MFVEIDVFPLSTAKMPAHIKADCENERGPGKSSRHLNNER